MLLEGGTGTDAPVAGLLVILTSMEQPISDPRLRAFVMIWSRLLGALSRSSNLVTTPPVKSVRASLVRPPLRFSYEPFSLHRPRPTLAALTTKVK